MTQNWVLALGILASVAMISYAQRDCFGEGPPSTPQTSRVTKGADNFAIEMFTAIATSYPRNSIVLSPYSVWSVLNLAYFGAKGDTAEQLRSALGVPTKGDAFYGGRIVETKLRLNKGTILKKADRAYFASDIVLNDCALSKLVELERVNFSNPNAAAAIINRDVEEATGGKIKKFLPPSVLQGARFVLLNAVYFKGLWKFPFLPSRTAVMPFYNEKREAVGNGSMMVTQAKLRYTESDRLGAAVLELPYEDSNISMLLLLPDPQTSTINSVLSRITSDVLDLATSQLKIRTTIVSIPRFKMTTRVADELKTALQRMGISDLFSAGRADMSHFSNEKTFVDEALHHSTIEVTEDGTVAAAATGLIGTRSGASDMVTFVADRPFIFLIRDMSQGITLFMGVLRDPEHTTPF